MPAGGSQCEHSLHLHEPEWQCRAQRTHRARAGEFRFLADQEHLHPKISENFNVQFRAEFFNIFNRANFQSPLDNIYLLNQNGTPVSGAGLIDATSTDPRLIQLALKLIW